MPPPGMLCTPARCPGLTGLDIWGPALCREDHPMSTGKGTPSLSPFRPAAQCWFAKDATSLITSWPCGPRSGCRSTLSLVLWEKEVTLSRNRSHWAGTVDGHLGCRSPRPGSCLWGSGQASTFSPRATLTNSGSQARETHTDAASCGWRPSGSVPDRHPPTPAQSCGSPHPQADRRPSRDIARCRGPGCPGAAPGPFAAGGRGAPAARQRPPRGSHSLGEPGSQPFLTTLTSALWKQLLLEGLSISLFLQEINTPHKVNGGFRQGAFTSSLSGLGLCSAPMTDPPTPGRQ